MGMPLARNWNLIKSLYLQGVSPTKLSQEHDVPYGTLVARIKRGKWKTEQQELSQAVRTDLVGRGQQWRLWAIDAADRFLNALRALPKNRVDKLSRQDVQSLRDVIEAGLRAYGLDKQGAEPIRLGVYIGSGAQVVLKSGNEHVQAIGVQGPIIDCGSAAQAQGEAVEAEKAGD